MIDFIKISASTEILIPNSFEPFEWKGLSFYPKFRKGLLIGFESEYENLKVSLYPNNIEVTNSIHKFCKKNNYSDFSYSELREAINIICQKFDIKPNLWEIKKLEFGFNIETPQPAKEFLFLFTEYKGREFEKMKDKHKDYGRKCFMSEYALKIYDKSFQVKVKDRVTISDKILRIEFCYSQKRKLPKGIRYLSDLLNRDKLKLLYKDLIDAFSKVIYASEIDFSNLDKEERRLYYASTNPNFIKTEERVDKHRVKETKRKIKKLKERFQNRKFKEWLLNHLKNKYLRLYCS